MILPVGAALGRRHGPIGTQAVTRL
jgi:hypothetical protein